MNKKILALLLAFAMMFSTITVAFADETATIGAEAEALKTMGVLQGDDGGVTPEYLAKETTRMQAAIMFLRLKGLEEEAMAFTGTTNFADADTMKWPEGKAIMAYLKANPQLGWIGADGGNFEPFALITVNQYYKVMLEALGYKQTTAEVMGDFTWTEVMEFAASKGLVKLAGNTEFTNNDLAIATIEGLKINVKDTAKTLAVSMVDAGMINKDAAIAAGLYAEEIAAVLDEASALGNTVVEVEFEGDVDAAAANADNYAINGLEINAAVITGADTVRLETAAQKAGTLYTLTVGEKSVQFTGIAKVSGGPELTDSVSEDVEEVVLTFDKNLDYESATNTANYSIAGVEIAKAEVSAAKEVTLTTVGLKDNTSYTVKVTNIESVDGVSRRSTSDSFRSNYDTAYPRINSSKTEVETNQRIVLYFNEKVTEESAEDLANYSIKVNETDGAELGIVSVTWDDDDENNVEIITEAMEDNEDYKLYVNNISDQRKVANTMTRQATWTFEGMDEDEDAPVLKDVTVIAKNQIIVEFTDDSKIDEASALDVSNYEFTKGSDVLDVDDVQTITNETGTFKALVTVEDMEAGKNYDLEVNYILDEFGNAMEEDSIAVNPKLADFASAALTSVVINGESKITLTFNKELNEASAENIANYSIDSEIGTPITATYDDDAKTVVLNVNDLTNGEKYDITVDGVIDLAGNVLTFTKEDILAAVADSNWDTEKPELEDAYAENMYVAALQFSEEVKFEAGTKLVLAVNGDLNNTIELTAKALTEDNTIVEFSLFDGTEWVELDDTVNYTVVEVVYGDTTGITDLVGNPYTASEDEYTFDGSNDEPDYAEVESYDQVNGGTFEVTMTKDVEFKNAEDIAAGKATVNGFEVTIDDNVVTFVGDIEEEAEYEFDLGAFMVDEHGMAVLNDEVDADEDINRTILVGEETDEEEPYVVDVTAADRQTVDVEFSEDIQIAEAADFSIKNVDTDKNVTISDIEIDGNVVTLTLSTALEGRYEYELTMDANEVADFSGNKAAEDVIYFDGSDLAALN